VDKTIIVVTSCILSSLGVNTKKYTPRQEGCEGFQIVDLTGALGNPSVSATLHDSVLPSASKTAAEPQVGAI